MSGYTENLTTRVTPEQAADVRRLAEREGVSPSAILRDATMRRVQTGTAGLVVGLDPDTARSVQAAAALAEADPERWAVAVLDEVAVRQLGGRGVALGIARKLERTKEPK